MTHHGAARCLLFLALLAGGCGPVHQPPSIAGKDRAPQGSIPAHGTVGPSQYPDLARLEAMTARYLVVPLGADVAGLPASERACLAKLVEAARIMDGIFLRQVWEGNVSLLPRLAADPSPLGRARLRYFLINIGPWSRLDADAPFIQGVPPKSGGGAFYPADATRDEIERWVQQLPGTSRAEATGFFSVIRRAPGGLVSVPYSLEYQGELFRAARLLEEAASLTARESLSIYLNRRAAALRNDDYYDSDMAWMELDSRIEAVIGPYEVYEDKWFGYKAAFAAFVMLRDEEGGARLSVLQRRLQELENNLPVDPARRNPRLGELAPVRVVNILFAAGDPGRGVPAAFLLPNDERVIAEKGAKRIIIANVIDALYRFLLQPAAAVLLAEGEGISREALFLNIVMHELMHGLGPQELSRNGSRIPVRLELKETYSAIEEAKADISGLWGLQYLIDQGVVDRRMERAMYATFLVSCLDAVRSGTGEPHADARALQLNALLDSGGFILKEGKFSVDHEKVRGAVKDLTAQLLELEGRGDRDAAKRMLAELAVVRPGVRQALEKVRELPAALLPDYYTAEQLTAGPPP
ncbi:MAG TPA: hypothetical protein VNX25_02715 [Verrucomicrobiae bacterium]|nr:hypothetical protein [Verrucomicrobiae bacterium]